MADVVIGLEAKDGASKVFVETGKSAEEMGKRTEQGAKKAKEALEELGKEAKKAGEETKKGSDGAKKSLIDQLREMEKLEKEAKDYLRLTERFGDSARQFKTVEEAVEHLKKEQLEAAAAAKKLAIANEQAAAAGKQASAAEIAKNQSSLGKLIADVDGKAKSGGGIAAGMLKAQVAFAAASKAADIFFGTVSRGVEGVVEAEKADRQLASALSTLGYNANDLLPALKAQADAFESNTFATAQQVQQMQQLLLRYGVAPRDIEKTTAAILDYSAATGKSATEAANQLMKGLDSGGQSLREMGVHMKTTGDRSRDLATAVDQLGRKFGGSARAQADGFGGQLDQLQKAQNKLGESFVSFIVKVEQKTGIIAGLTEALRNAAVAIGGDEQMQAVDKWKAQVEQVDRLTQKLKEAERIEAALFEAPRGETMRDRFGGLYDYDSAFNAKMKLIDEVEAAKKHAAELRKAVRSANGEITEGTSETAKEINTGTQKIVDAFEGRRRRLEEEHKKTLGVISLGAMSTDVDAIQKQADEAQKAINEWINGNQELAAADIAEMNAILLESQSATQETLNRMVEESLKAEENMRSAGVAIGMAFISGLDSQLQQMNSGGEFDVGQMVAAILPAAIGAIMLLNPATAPFAPLVAGAAGMLTRQMMSGGMKGPKVFHSGGYVDDGRPRYHSGGLASDEVDAVLQKGEYVVPRGDVARMGGPRGVEQATRGGGQMHVYVSTLDSQSFSEFMGDRGGSGMVRTVAQNRGEFAQRLRRVGVRG